MSISVTRAKAHTDHARWIVGPEAPAYSAGNCHALWITFATMDTVPSPADRPDAVAVRPETEAERHNRLAWEAAGIAEARADVAAGRVVDSIEVDAWIDSLGTEHELPAPYAGR